MHIYIYMCGAIHFVLVLCLRSKQADPFSNGSTAFSSHALRTGSQDARKRFEEEEEAFAAPSTLSWFRVHLFRAQGSSFQVLDSGFMM